MVSFNIIGTLAGDKQMYVQEHLHKKRNML